MKPKLRDVIGFYAGWVAALGFAFRLGTIDIFDLDAKTVQLRDAARAWIGEELLEREL